MSEVEDLKRVEEEVLKKQAEALKVKASEQAVEIESKVRKEMEAKMESEKLHEQLEKQSKELEAFREESDKRTKALEEAFKKQLEDALAVKKGVAKNESPFEAEKNPNLRTLQDGSIIDVSKLDMAQVEEDSRRAFIQAHRLPSDWGKPVGK